MSINAFGQPVHYYETLSSTNAQARALMHEKDLPEGALVYTFNQTSGRGYGTNRWESAPNQNLTLSFILKPSFVKPDRQFIITQVLSLAVMETVGHYIKNTAQKKITIKWPNDVYVGKNKIAGILVENTLLGDTITASIAGIGLNINQTEFSTDIPNPTSLQLEKGAEIRLDEAMKLLSCKLGEWYSKLRNRQNEQITKSYHENLYVLGEKALFSNHKQTFKAVIRGIGEYGQLVLEREDGSLEKFDFKEVVFLH